MPTDNLNIPANKIIKKTCKICPLTPMRDSEFCYHHNPNYKKPVLPNFKNLTTIEGIKRSYGDLLNALKDNKIDKTKAQVLFYGLNSFVKSMRDLLDMKLEIDKTTPQTIITEGKIEQLKGIVDKLDSLSQEFKDSNEPVPSGEISDK